MLGYVVFMVLLASSSDRLPAYLVGFLLHVYETAKQSQSEKGKKNYLQNISPREIAYSVVSEF